MSRSQKLMVWVFLTILVVLALQGGLTIAYYYKISSNTTCNSIGGEWVETKYQCICVINKGEAK